MAGPASGTHGKHGNGTGIRGPQYVKFRPMWLGPRQIGARVKFEIAFGPSRRRLTSGPAARATAVPVAAVACMVIEADPEGFSPGRVAAAGVCGGLAEGERPF